VESAAPLAARAFAEVYPHAGMVALFDLPKIIKYKKGTVDEKRTGLEALRSLLASLLHAEPRVVDSDMLRSLLGKGLDGLRRQELKAYEDSLDALFCGYLAYYVWYWGWTKNEVFGEVRTGYIMNPKLVPGGVGRAA
jgi:predicted RNase H-like nuclease